MSAIIQTLVILLLIAVIVATVFRVPFYLKLTLFGLSILLILVQCLRLKYPLLLIDRIFANYPGKQIALTLVIFIICFDFALCIFPKDGVRSTFSNFISYTRLTEEVSDEIGIAFDTIQHKPNANQIAIYEKPASNRKRSDYVKYGIVYLLGLVVFSGLLIATINRFMATRAERYKKGANTYKRISNHYVIIGYGPTCVPIIRNIQDRRKMERDALFLLLTRQDPETVRRDIASQLNDLEEMTVIYSGDMSSMTQLARLNIGSAKEVYVLGEGKEPGRDSKNMECAKMIKTLRDKKSQDNVLHVNMQLDKPTSYSTIKRITFPASYYKNESGQEVTYIRPFNFYENWARLLWGTYSINDYRPLDRGKMAVDGHHVHLVIAGFNEMGVALLLEALRICHYPNYDETTGANKTLITVIDPRMNELLPVFKAQYPYLSQIKDVEIDYRRGRIEDDDNRIILDQAASRNDTSLTVAICFFDSDNSFSSALTLPDTLYYHIKDGEVIPNTNTEILVRQEINSGLSDLLANENGHYANVKIFGTLDKGVDDRLLNDEMAIIISAYYHFKYDLESEKSFFELVEEAPDSTWKEAFDNWIALNEDKRFANRYQTEIYTAYQRYRSCFEKDPDTLYQTEHYRWCAERSITGYRDIHEQNIKNDTYQLHRSIIPYRELSLFEKGKDKDVLKIMDQVMEMAARHDQAITF